MRQLSSCQRGSKSKWGCRQTSRQIQVDLKGRRVANSGKGEKGDEVASGVRTIIFATKATSARPQSEINSSRGLLTLSIIPLAIRARHKYRRVKPTVFPTSQFSLADSKSEYRMAFPDKPSRSILYPNYILSL